MTYTDPRFGAAARRRAKRRRFRLLALLLPLALLGSGFALDRFLAPEQSPGIPGLTQPLDGHARAPAVPDDWNLILVNSAHPLPDDFTVPALTELRWGESIDSRVYPELQRMMDDARAAGLKPLICSSYRSADKQTTLFENKVGTYLAEGVDRQTAEQKAAQWVARPGTSEHQAGLAVDIVSEDYQLLDEAQQHTDVQQWLMAHCADYGFILRYPTDKSDLTGVGFEPWHYRYVGQETAKEITAQGVCLEEYLAAA